MPRDEYGEYEKDAGSDEPVEGRCNATLRHWRSRYGERRHCGQLPEKTFVDDGSDFCRTHKDREQLYMQAEELMQHGLYTKSIDHFYDKLAPTEKVFIWGIYEQLLGESRYEFGVETEGREVDFSDSDFKPPQADESDSIELEVPRPTEHIDRALALFRAATDAVKMMKMNARIMEDNAETVTHSDSELDYDTGEWSTLDEMTEHHLNLPYSRLTRDRKEDLKYGGVDTGIDQEISVNKNQMDEIILDIEADSPEGVKESSGMSDLEVE